MQIVIDIPDKTYNAIKTGSYDYGDMNLIIENGAVLPKGHGRLIDADKLQEEMKKDIRRAMSFVDLTDFVWLAPTVIEAEKTKEQ